MKKGSVVLVLFFLSLVFFFYSCKKNDQYQQSPNGLQYRIITDAKKPKAKQGEIAQYSAVWRNAKDSIILNTSASNAPQYGEVYKPKFKGDPIELLNMMGPGDSGSCRVSVDTMFKGYPLPPFLKHGDIITLDLKMMSLISKEDYKKMAESKMNEEYNNEIQQIQAYIAQNNLKATSDSLGIFYVIDDPGKGKQPKEGSNVTVNYTGKLMSNGQEFDSSLKPGKQPLQVVLGNHQVITGWDFGLRYFKEGSKGKLILPSRLGYGERGNGKIPPNSILVFDIQMLSVK
ncbi:MAG: FKBP-type peptidyl-prolyl cis-trans isomerase [Chitinophagales bacterium]|nr:FKBP-type peptidyl-prolyl cis-trans isomerase [Chitinophagales bacterium]